MGVFDKNAIEKEEAVLNQLKRRLAEKEAELGENQKALTKLKEEREQFEAEMTEKEEALFAEHQLDYLDYRRTIKSIELQRIKIDELNKIQ